MQMVKYFRVASLSFLLLSSLLLSGGCSVYMAANQPDKKETSLFDVGTSRSALILEFGQPALTEDRGGTEYDLFVFVDGYTSGGKTGRTVGHAAASIMTLGLWEIVGTPLESSFDGDKMSYEVCYDANRKVAMARQLSGPDMDDEDSDEDAEDEPDEDSDNIERGDARLCAVSKSASESVTTATGNDGQANPGLRLLLGSFPDRNAAKAKWDQMRRTYPELTDAHGGIVETKDAVGTIYKLYVEGLPDDKLTEVCRTIREEGSICEPITA
jgi:hypothetical protein